eukprot:6179030-Pleurochrysis_carterae.AAC.4
MAARAVSFSTVVAAIFIPIYTARRFRANAGAGGDARFLGRAHSLRGDVLQQVSYCSVTSESFMNGLRWTCHKSATRPLPAVLSGKSSCTQARVVW